MAHLKRVSRRLLGVAGFVIAAIVICVTLREFIWPETMFERHVFHDREHIRNLKYGTVSCMHCPMYFRFNTNSAIAAQIVAIHRLAPLEKMPPVMEQIESQIYEEWWIDRKSLALARKYWVEFEPVRNDEGESRIRMALIDGDAIYFVTNGYKDFDN